MTLAEPDSLAALADRVLAMPPETRQRFLASRSDDDLELVERAIRAKTDPGGRRVYRQLGYEPICIPRVKAALTLGYANPIEAEDAGAILPPMCGECPQEAFDTATEFDVFFGGAVGPGKTRSMLMLGVRWCARWRGFRGLFLRETFDELDENVFPELRKIEYAAAVGGHWNAGRKELELPGASVIRFRYLENIADIGRRAGGSYQALFIDERTQLPPGVVDGLRDRLRSAEGVPVMGVRSTGNPGGRSHGELKRDYVEATDHGASIVRVPIPGSAHLYHERRFIPAKATDNPYLGDDYYDKVLSGIADPARRKSMRDGDWSAFSGQFFAEWSHERHVVPRNAVELAESWKRFAGIDYGYAAPWSVHWAALDGDLRIWFYREEYATKVGEKEQAQRIVDAEKAAGETRVHRAGDPSMWAKAGDAPPVAEVYRRAGATMHQADNARLSGWARMHTFLEDGPACRYHRTLGWEECPMLHVLEGTCPNLVRTLPDLPFDPRRVEDLDCFVAGTLVDTPNGPRAVETISVGDLVDTPIGPRLVIYAGVSGLGPVMRVEFDNGESLTGTPDHCVVTHTRGLVALEDLRRSDILATRNTTEQVWRSRSSGASRSSTRASATRVLPVGSTSQPLDERRSTARSSSTTTARFRLASTSITSTMTTTTTPPRISWPSRLLNMVATIWSNAGRNPATTSAPTRSIAAPLGEQLHGRGWPKDELTLQREKSRADVVALLSSRRTRRRLFAQRYVPMSTRRRPRIFGRARSAAASSAASEATPTQCRPVRIVAAGSFVADAQVYRLTVDEIGLYYANGVSVTNTRAEDHAADSARYLIGEIARRSAAVGTVSMPGSQPVR